MPTKRLRLNIDEEDDFSNYFKEHNEIELSIDEDQTEVIYENYKPAWRRIAQRNDEGTFVNQKCIAWNATPKCNTFFTT